jgi:hypothetical protein
MKSRTVVQRKQISQWVTLIIYSDGSAAIWQGTNRVELTSYEAMRLGILDEKETQACLQQSR